MRIEKWNKIARGASLMAGSALIADGALVPHASPVALAVGALFLGLPAAMRERPQRPHPRCKCRPCRRHPHNDSLSCRCRTAQFAHKCWHCQSERSKAEGLLHAAADGLYWNNALDKWAPYPDTAEVDVGHQLAILRDAYVKGLGVAILETYTEKVLRGATVRECLAHDFKSFASTLDGLKESLGSLRDQFPPDTEADTLAGGAKQDDCVHVWPAGRDECDDCGITKSQYSAQMRDRYATPAELTKLTGGERRRLAEYAAELRARKREYERVLARKAEAVADFQRRHGRARVHERPGTPIFKFEYPISGHRISIMASDIVAITDNGEGAGVDVKTRNGGTFRNMRALGRWETVQREFVNDASPAFGRRLNPDPSQVQRHERKAKRARAMGDMASATQHTDEAARLRAGFTRTDWHHR